MNLAEETPDSVISTLTLSMQGRRFMPSLVKTVRSAAFTSLVYVVARNRRSAIVRGLGWLASAILKACENCSFDLRLDGEHAVLKCLSAVDALAVVFDVGANRGKWAELALRECPEATVHCFELAQPVFAILTRNLGMRSNVILNSFGLADREEKLLINFSAEDDGLTSLLTPLGVGSSEALLEAEIRTGDRYLVSKNLELVDLLKVDVEGAELLVFAGFKEAFASRRFRCIQFEYGHARASLREYYNFFDALGYRVGKIFPDGCDFGPYLPRREQVASNYIAVRDDQHEIIKALDSF